MQRLRYMKRMIHISSWQKKNNKNQYNLSTSNLISNIKKNLVFNSKAASNLYDDVNFDSKTIIKLTCFSH